MPSSYLYNIWLLILSSSWAHVVINSSKNQPEPPQNLNYVVLSSTSVLLTWDAVHPLNGKIKAYSVHYVESGNSLSLTRCWYICSISSWIMFPNILKICWWYILLCICPPSEWICISQYREQCNGEAGSVTKYITPSRRSQAQHKLYSLC